MAVPSAPESDLLKSTPLFQNLNPAQLELAAQAATRRQVEADAFFYFQEDPAKTIYVLIQGRVKLTQVTPEGQQVILRYANPGEAFGVIAALSESTYPVAAQAVEESVVLAWGEVEMHRLMEQIPPLSINALRILASRIREFQDRLRELATEKVERRIAHTLLRLARQTGRKVPEGVLIDMHLTRQDLAEMTGTTLYTVSRTLSQWEAKGLVQSSRERVVIRFPHGLVSIAEDLIFGDTPDNFPKEK
jgi:CRP-like cAMP-binding protein